MKLIWKRLSDRAMAPHTQAGERLPFTVCQIGPVNACTYEAWDKRGEYPAQIKTGCATYQEAQKAVISAIGAGA